MANHYQELLTKTKFCCSEERQNDEELPEARCARQLFLFSLDSMG
jgi:hypothetical protein